MTSVTLQLDDKVVAIAREIVARRASSLDELVEDSLRQFAAADAESPDDLKGESFSGFLRRFARYDTGGPYTRDELNAK